MQTRGVNADGGFFTNPQLSNDIRMSAIATYIFRQFIAKKEEAIGKRKGDTVLWDQITQVATGGGKLVETATVPKDSYKIVQASMTISEYGNSIPWTQKLAALPSLM